MYSQFMMHGQKNIVRLIQLTNGPIFVKSLPALLVIC